MTSLAAERPPPGWGELAGPGTAREAARVYAALGLNPIAINGLTGGKCTCGKPACPAAGKHPVARGWQTAPLDFEALDTLLRKRPSLNIGLRMGPQPGGFELICVDVDGDLALLEPLETKHGKLPPTLTAKTSSGYHLIYRVENSARFSNAVGLVPGVDLRSKSGQIVAAPSRHASGHTYDWIDCREPTVLTMTDCLSGIPKKERKTSTRVAADPKPNAQTLGSDAASGSLPTLGVEGTPYGLKQLEKRRHVLRGLAVDCHKRNSELFKAAFCVASLIHEGRLAPASKNTICNALLHDALLIGLETDEIEETIKSGFRQAADKAAADASADWPEGWEADFFRVEREPAEQAPEPEQAPAEAQNSAPTGLTFEPRPELAELQAPDGQVVTLLRGFKLTDLGNGERLVARYRAQIRWCPDRKRWVTWGGKRWDWDHTGEVERLAKKTTRAIYGEAEHAGTDKEAQAIAAHAHASERHGRLFAMIEQAKSEAGIAVRPAEFDSDLWAFNVQNGTLNLQTGALREHTRSDLITKISPVTYDPNAKSALWDRFMAQVTGGDSELAAYLQRAVGYALQGRVTEKSFWFLYGAPDGMKSTFIDAISSVFGDYAVTVGFTTWLTHSNVGGTRSDIVSLMGARLVTSVEVSKDAVFDEEIIKKITGGDMLEAHAKYELPVRFMPSFSLWLAANDSPTIRDDDEGAWSRVRRVPFNSLLPKAQRDPNMRERLRAPEVQSAILAWAVKGCLAWQASGLGTCGAMVASTASYRQESDPVSGFFAELCSFEPAGKVASKDLQQAYADWCADSGITRPLSAKAFGVRLVALGCQPGRGGRCRFWRGVRLL